MSRTLLSVLCDTERSKQMTSNEITLFLTPGKKQDSKVVCYLTFLCINCKPLSLL